MKMVDVFISYSRTNRDIVCRLADAIGRLGYVVWWDEELPAHLSYGDVITQKIGEAKATLVVWSAESAASEWVRAEADMARNAKKLIQTAIGDCTPPLPFNQIQYAAIDDWTGEEDHPGWRKARASLAALCGPAPAETASPAPEPVAPEPAAPEPVAAVAPPPAAVAAPPPPAAVVPPQPQPRPRIARAAPRSRANRLALVAIAASVMVILSVGGLVLLKGPPAAQAKAPPVALAAAPAQGPAPAVMPPKTVVVDTPVQSGEEGAEGQEADATDYGSESGDDY
jgi:hypothetical protein